MNQNNYVNFFLNDSYIKTNGDVFAFSDIHGDIDALIINLRDNAKVIKKKDNIDFKQTDYDQDLKRLLKLNLNTDEKDYIDDLNYDWCGNDAIVVIIGDIIDGNRGVNTEHYYPQVEIKILRFLNAIFAKAILKNGNVIKLCGNHELLNFINYDQYYKYIFDQDRIPNYYNNINRENYFNYDKAGFKLYTAGGGTGFYVKINDNIFIHGGLVFNNEIKEIKHYETYNVILNSNNDNLIETFINTIKSNVDELIEPLLTRGFNFDKKSDDYCKILDTNLSKFKANKLFVGHCTQHTITTDNLLNNYENKTFGNVSYKDDINIIYDNQNIYTGVNKYDKDDNDILFGIGMDCINNNIPKLIRVDTGISRGFDDIINNLIALDFKKYNNRSNEENIIKKIIKAIYGIKTPQLFKIASNNTLSIIKSTIKNTKIHLPRSNFTKKDINDNNNNLNQIYLDALLIFNICNEVKKELYEIEEDVMTKQKNFVINSSTIINNISKKIKNLTTEIIKEETNQNNPNIINNLQMKKKIFKIIKKKYEDENNKNMNELNNLGQNSPEYGDKKIEMFNKRLEDIKEFHNLGQNLIKKDEYIQKKENESIELFGKIHTDLVNVKDTEYFKKYLKYKNKYVSLKSKIKD